jgi:hypothetical protein
MAWLKSQDSHQSDSEYDALNRTLNYWAMRFEPLIESKKDTVVAICNRSGEERGTLFCGSSCVLVFHEGRVNCLGIVGVNDERVLKVQIQL